jgi:hypothetical protein
MLDSDLIQYQGIIICASIIINIFKVFYYALWLNAIASIGDGDQTKLHILSCWINIFGVVMLLKNSCMVCLLISYMHYIKHSNSTMTNISKICPFLLDSIVKLIDSICFIIIAYAIDQKDINNNDWSWILYIVGLMTILRVLLLFINLYKIRNELNEYPDDVLIYETKQYQYLNTIDKYIFRIFITLIFALILLYYINYNISELINGFYSISICISILLIIYIISIKTSYKRAYKISKQKKLYGSILSNTYPNKFPTIVYEKSLGTCVICLHHPIISKPFMPCGHMCCCNSCTTDLFKQSNKKCPLCRTKFEGVLDIRVKVPLICSICKKDPITTSAFIPCGHQCCCNKCSHTLLLSKSKCPECNNSIHAIHQIYIPV